MEKLLGIHREWPETDFDVFHGRHDIGDDFLQLQHLPFREMNAIKDVSFAEAYDRFTIVRNPWDRLVSEFFWQKQYRETLSFKKFLQFTSNVVRNRIRIKGEFCHLRPQVEFLDDQIDSILRFENFETDVRKLLRKWNIQVDRVPRFGATARVGYQEMYDAESAELVEELYRRDVEDLDYQFSTPLPER